MQYTWPCTISRKGGLRIVVKHFTRVSELEKEGTWWECSECNTDYGGVTGIIIIRSNKYDQGDEWLRCNARGSLEEKMLRK